ncbi:MAG TPA: aldo/keto reductase [Synergistaceae bacterium]|nr:aldo/keto reductase [Synergistaceae bacterium]HPJ25398.1 aldo/keto reductase [Synergistaceae bacterium]HPQ37579.1 aldo/keto reductase [Synergistaceae bacterium]
METIRLGKTELHVTRTSFGALPIQRVDFETARTLLRKAYDNGINYVDTARMYSDSEEKIGYALGDVREKMIISTKSHGKNAKELEEHLETSLKNMKTDYIDIHQLHLAKKVHAPGEPDGLYDGMLKAKEQGKIRFIGITTHSVDVALEAAASGLYDTVQFPLNHLSSEKDLSLIEVAKKHDVGVIAMKGMSGGIITKAVLPFAFLRQYSNVVPIWGVQHEWELDEFIALEASPPVLDEALWEEIEKDRKELAGNFCRACGYCLPCPADIDIPQAARMIYLLRRMPWQTYVTPEWKAKMEKIKDCINCGACKSRCPYGLDTPELLRKNLEEYEKFYAEHCPEEA